MKSGWHGESYRHYLAAKGIKSKRSKFDIAQILGRWKQESVRPEPPFQKGCVEVQAEYELQKDGTVKVTNKCKNKDGKVRSIQGKGFPTNDPRKLKVDFFPGVPFTAGDFNVTKFDGKNMTVEGGGYKWQLEKINDKKVYLKSYSPLGSGGARRYNYTPTYTAGDLTAISTDGIGTAGAAAVPLIPLVVMAGLLYGGVKVAKNQVDKAKASSKKSKKSYNASKEYYAVKTSDEEYQEWRELVNMSPEELKEFKKTELGKKAGLSREEAKKKGIGSGQESADAILRMRKKSPSKWTDKEEEWMERQNSFVARMKGVKGPLFDKKGKPTRKHTALKIWGHDPLKKEPWQGNKFHPKV